MDRHRLARRIFAQNQRGRLVGEVVFSRRNRRIVARDRERRAWLCALDLDLVLERHRHHDRVDEMIAVAPFAHDAEREIHLRRRSNPHGVLGNIGRRGKTKEVYFLRQHRPAFRLIADSM